MIFVLIETTNELVLVQSTEEKVRTLMVRNFPNCIYFFADVSTENI